MGKKHPHEDGHGWAYIIIHIIHSIEIPDITALFPLLAEVPVERPTHVLSTLHGSASYTFGKQSPQ